MTDSVDRARVFGERPDAVERMAPGYFDPAFEAESLARYRWASRWVRDRVVLDVACGTGYGASILRGAGARIVVSVDLSRDALRFGRPRYGLAPVCSDAHQLPVAPEACDTVVSLETIEHLPDVVAFVGELQRVLRPRGELLLSTPNAGRSSGKNPYHVHEMTLRELRSVLENAGFQVTGTWGQHWGLPLGVWHRIKGVRRMLWEIERVAAVTRWIRAGLMPLYWCVHAVRA